MGGVQQRLGRDAAAVQTDTAQDLLALDEDYLLAEVCRVKSRGITARPCAHNYDFGSYRFHIQKVIIRFLRAASIPAIAADVSA